PVGGMAGVGSKDAEGVLTLAGGDKFLSQRTLIYYAAAATTSVCTLSLHDALPIYLAGATFEVQCDSSWTAINGSPTTFTNAGILNRKSTSLDTSFLIILYALAFNNTGTLEVQSGTLDIACGGSGSGSFLVDAGATL